MPYLFNAIVEVQMDILQLISILLVMEKDPQLLSLEATIHLMRLEDTLVWLGATQKDSKVILMLSSLLFSQHTKNSIIRELMVLMLFIMSPLKVLHLDHMILQQQVLSILKYHLPTEIVTMGKALLLTLQLVRLPI
jgi:hypothetical protein